MGTPLTLIALIAVMPNSTTTMKGSEAFQQLQNFENQYRADAKTNHKKLNALEYRNAITKKANDLLMGVDVTTVPPSEGRDWSKVLEQADRYEDAANLLDKFAGTSPTSKDLFDARVEEANDDLAVDHVYAATKATDDLKPYDDKSARSLAIVDERLATEIGETNAVAGKSFLDGSKSSFMGYEKITAPILKSGESTLKALGVEQTLPSTPAPELSIMGDKYGSYTNLDALKGKVVILDFFAHWCGPCKASMPDMRALSDELGSKLQVIGVTSYYGYFGDPKKKLTESEEFADMKGFMAQYRIDHPVVYVPRDEDTKYGIYGIPEFVLIGKDGKVLKVQVGYDHESFVEFRQAAENAASITP